LIKRRKLSPARQYSHTLLAGASMLSAMGGAAVTAPAMAQQAQADTPVSMPAVQVTGQGNAYKPEQLSSPKFTQPLVDTTQTVTVITEKVMREQQATTLTEALRNVPGVGTFYAGENGSTSTGDSVYMRGFDTSNSIFIDGIRDTSTVYRDMFNTSAVEVIKGPSGSDYGRSAPSGSINLVTKQPKLENSFDATLGFGTAKYKRSTIDWNQAIGDTSAFRLNVMGMKSDVAGRNEIENNRTGIAPSFAWGLGTDTRIFVDVMHVKQTNVPDGGVSTVGLPGYSAPGPAFSFMGSAKPVNSRNFYGTSSDHDDSTTDMATLRAEHDFTPNTTLRNTTRWSRTKQDYLLQSFNASAANLTIGNPNDPSTWFMARTPTVKDISNKLITNQTNLTTKFNTGSLKHDLSTGVEFTRESQVTFGTNAFTLPPVSIYHPDSSISAPHISRNGANADGTTDTAAIYAFDTIEVAKDWQVNGGMRLDHYKTRFNSETACGGTGRTIVPCNGAPVNTAIKTIDAKTSGNLVDWKLGALYRLTENGNVYVNYAVSQQPPGGSNFSLATSGNSANRTDFTPQKAKTAEVGTKWDLLDHNLLLTAALFRTEVSNEVQAEDDGTFSQTGKKRVQGLELGAMGQINQNWSITTGYTIQNATVDQGSAVNADGSNSLSYTPKHAFSLWSTYKLPAGFSLGGGARYVGGLKRGTDGAVGTPDFTRAYWVFDAVAAYQVTKNFGLQLNAYNLFDKEYVASINKSGYRYRPGTPRTFLLSANLAF
jgi:catecholate siderophore receptor